MPAFDVRREILLTAPRLRGAVAADPGLVPDLRFDEEQVVVGMRRDVEKLETGAGIGASSLLRSVSWPVAPLSYRHEGTGACTGMVGTNGAIVRPKGLEGGPAG